MVSEEIKILIENFRKNPFGISQAISNLKGTNYPTHIVLIEIKRLVIWGYYTALLDTGNITKEEYEQLKEDEPGLKEHIETERKEGRLK